MFKESSPPNMFVDRNATAACYDEHGGHCSPEHTELVTAIGKNPHITDAEMPTQQHREEEIKAAEEGQNSALSRQLD